MKTTAPPIIAYQSLVKSRLHPYQYLILLFFVFSLLPLQAQFTQMNPGLSLFNYGHIAPGDFDNDGDLDLFLIGTSTVYTGSKIFRNEGNWVFTALDFEFPSFNDGYASWGDFDKDGWLDLAVSGALNHNAYASHFKIYRNLQGLGFADFPTTLPEIQESNLLWADTNNDGNLDLVYQGMHLGTRDRQVQHGIYRNLGNLQFMYYPLGTADYFDGKLGMADMNADGYLDIALSGEKRVGGIYTGDSDLYYQTPTGQYYTAIPNAYQGGSGFDWLDYDADGDLDFLYGGYDQHNSAYFCHILKNNGVDSLEVVPLSVTGLWNGDIACADYDNDGDSDAFMCGQLWESTQAFSKLYNNDGTGALTPTADYFTPVYESRVQWADLDADGDLDLILQGEEHSPGVTGDRMCYFRNNTITQNTPPQIPSITCSPEGYLIVTSNGDDHTPPQLLSYDIRIGSYPGGCDIYRPMADLQTGTRRISGPGRYNFKGYDLSSGLFYVSAQAIDSAWLGSPFCEELIIHDGVPVSDITQNAAPLLLSVSPNPFSTATKVRFSLPAGADARIEVYNLKGQRLATLHSGFLAKGMHEIAWNTISDKGAPLASGIYLIKLSAQGKTHTTKLAVFR